jgi:hypothetical protein
MRLETAPIVSLNPMNMAPFELQWLIGQGRVTAPQSRTPPRDVIFAAIEMTLRRFFPKDCQQILLQMKAMGLSAKDYMNLVKNKGKLAVWIYTKSRLQGVEQYTPQIYDLGVIQEQVDEEENARIEELSLGGSLTLPLPPEANSAMGTLGEQQGRDTEAVDQEVKFNLKEVIEETLNLADRKRTLFEDLDPLDPMGTVLERALELGVEVVVARSRLIHQQLMNSFEVSSYIPTEIPQDVPPVKEMNYPYDSVNFVYSGVRAAEAREILMREVVDQWLLKYYPDAVQTVQFMLKMKMLNEISQLCCAPS